MRRAFRVSATVVGLASAVALFATLRSSKPPIPARAPSPVFVRAAPASTPVVRFVDLDKPTVPIMFEPDGDITISVRALVPSGNYRAQLIDPTRGEPVWIKIDAPEIELSPGRGKICDERQADLQRVVRARTPDAAIEARDRFLAAPYDQKCPALEQGFDWQLTRLSPVLAYSLHPRGDGKVKLVLQRLDAAGKVAKTWEWQLVIPPKSPKPKDGRALTEEASIALATARRIAELLDQPGLISIDPIETVPLRYELRTPSGTIAVGKNAWDPSSFGPFVHALVQQRESSAIRSAPADILAALTSPRLDVFMALNKDLSAALAADRMNPRTQEASALLLGALALRAPLISLDDTKGLINAMVAHLAIAHQFSGGRQGVEGEVALAALDLLVGRDVPATARVNRLSPRLVGTAGLAWKRALLMRANGDWRTYRADANATLLERLEYVRALERSWSSKRAAEVLEELKPDTRDLALWCRVVLEKENGVEVGAMTRSCLDAEMDQGALIAQAFHAVKPEGWWLKRTSGEERSPITAEMWRRFTEGSIVDAIWKLDHNLEELAQSALRHGFRRDVLKSFGDSTLVESLGSYWATQRQGDPSPPCDALAEAIKEDPSRISARAWHMANLGCSGRIPDPTVWFSPWTPQGTVFDHRNRLEGLLGEAKKTDLASLRSLVYYEPLLLYMSNPRDPIASDFEQYRAERAYSLRLLGDWTRVQQALNRPEEALQPARESCRLDSSACFSLVPILVDRGQIDEAYETAIRAHKEAGGTVAASDEVVWLIDEHIRRGRLEDARRLAKTAASTGSHAGLIAEARVAEREGDDGTALKLYREIDERYQSVDAAAFDLRRLSRSGADRATIARAIAAIGQPDPLSLLVTDAWLEGVGLVRRQEALRMGVRPGDTFVRVQGYETKNVQQFWAAVMLEDTPVLEFVVTSQARGKEQTLRGEFSRALHGRLTRQGQAPTR